jgi:hypothetical protein
VIQIEKLKFIRVIKAKKGLELSLEPHPKALLQGLHKPLTALFTLPISTIMEQNS